MKQSKQEEIFTDHTVLNFGMHKGKTVANVPASYLIHLYDNLFAIPAGLKYYIAANYNMLYQESKKEKGYR